MQSVLIAVTFVTLGVACAFAYKVDLAPGADQVRLTTNPSDVATCKPVGNLRVPPDTPPSDLTPIFRNQVIGLGGNAGFVTVGRINFPLDGVAYQCP
jgi:hypothetical protein